MSVTHETTIWCDGDACAYWLRVASGRARDARAAAHAEGWTKVGKRDLCPLCTKKIADAVKGRAPR